VQRSALCRSRRELSNAYLLAKIGVDTAENEPLEVWGENSIHYSLHSLAPRRARADVPARPSTALQPEPERGSTTLQPEAERNRKAMKSCETAESSCEGAEYVNETSAEQIRTEGPAAC